MSYNFGETLGRKLLAHVQSAQKTWPLPITAGALAAGTPLVAFADGASTTPGLALVNSKAFGVRWNNHATPAAEYLSVPMPQDLDSSQPVEVHILASKTGATLADTCPFTCEVFFQTVGALHDADVDAGGDSGAMTGDAAAKTVQEVVLTIAASDVPDSPSALTFSFKPKAGKLGTDDVVVEAAWLEYTGKVMTS